MTTSVFVGKSEHLKAQCFCIPGSGILKFSMTARRVAARRSPVAITFGLPGRPSQSQTEPLDCGQLPCLVVRVSNVCRYIRDEDAADLPTGFAVSGQCYIDGDRDIMIILLAIYMHVSASCNIINLYWWPLWLHRSHYCSAECLSQ